jgi:hypothetical protein
MKIKDRRLVVILFVAAALFLLSALCRHNWFLHARLNMLLRGYVFCQVEVPPDLGKVRDFHPTGFVSGLVYAKGVCVGSLNRYGAFVLRNETDISTDEREARTEIILFVSEYLFGAVLAGATLALVAKIAMRKSVSSS